MTDQKPHTDHSEQQPPSNFTQLVIMLTSTSLQQMGMMPGPDGQRPEPHIPEAQAMIDIIEMLEVKTKGNLDDEEKKMLAETLTMLRFQFVEVAKAVRSHGKKASPDKETADQPEDATPPADAEEPIITSRPTDDSDDQKKKYTKSYG